MLLRNDIPSQILFTESSHIEVDLFRAVFIALGSVLTDLLSWIILFFKWLLSERLT